MTPTQRVNVMLDELRRLWAILHLLQPEEITKAGKFVLGLTTEK